MDKQGSVASSVSTGKTKIDKNALKSMSKHKVQQMLRDKNPQMLQKIDEEVNAQIVALKRKILLAGFVIVVATVSIVFWR